MIAGGQFYQRLGMKRVINASSWVTVLGGSIMPLAVVKAMEDASRWFIDMHELHDKTGEIIAKLTGAEAGLVTAGSAAGMILQAAACITGTDSSKIDKLPDTTGLKNEIIIHRAHRVNYDHNYRIAGCKLIEIGNTRTTNEWELEDAINESTVAVAYVFAPRQGGAIPLSRVAEIAHARDIPVIVDAAAMLPPPQNLHRYIDMGADMVSFSGGKGVMGPQSTGILAGRRDLIEAAAMNGAPNNTGIGRSAKVCKEEIVGLITALEMFVDADHNAIQAKWESKCNYMMSELGAISGLKLELSEACPMLDEADRTHPRVLIYFDEAWAGPSESEVVRHLMDGDPSIRVRAASYVGGIAIVPVNLMDGDEEIIVRRIKEISNRNL